MNADELRADDFADAPLEAMGPDGPVTVARAVWVPDDTLADLQREVGTHRNLHPDEEV